MQVCPSCGEENPERFRLCGFCGTPLAVAPAAREERRTVTVVFSDLQGSTKLGEALDPESVRSVMSSYFDAMTAVLRRHGGTVEKFIGDAIMAVFGLPTIHEDDALRAARAAREMQLALEVHNEDHDRRFGIRLTNRTGVNSGEVVTGDAATSQRLVTGDTVNTAARLEQAAGPNEVLIGDLTWRLIRDAVSVEPVEPLELKGKAERVPAYRLMGVGSSAEGFSRREDAGFVGRDAELRVLANLGVEAAAGSRTRVAVVVGEAGVGKSRIIREAVARMPAQAVVLHGRCLPYGDGITFWPVSMALRSAAEIADDDTPAAAMDKLRRMVADPGLADRLGSILGFSEEPYSIEELFWAVRRFLGGLATAERPAVWVVDDIHWAERTLLDLIGYLASEHEGAPIVVLCSARHELLERQREWADTLDADLIELGPLDDDDAALVIANLLGATEIEPRVRARIVTAAQGNPLFVEQLISMLVDSGKLRRAGDRWETDGNLDELSVPPTIQALVAARLGLLSIDERAVVEPASVIGLEFAEAAVAALAPDTLVPHVPRHLDVVAGKQLITRIPGSVADADGIEFRFHHILVRDGAYQQLLKRTRADLHARFVVWADAVNQERDRATEFEEILGYHLEQAHRYLGELGPLDDAGRSLGVDASRRLSSAGRRAMGRGDMPAAAALLRRATALLDPGPEQVALLIDLGEALTETGGFAEAEVMLGSAIELATALAEPRLAAKGRLMQLAAQLYTGSAPQWGADVEAAVSTALPIFEASGDADGQALAWRLRFGLNGMTLRFEQAAIAAQQVVTHARAAGNRRYETRGASGYATSALLGPTPVRAAIDRCTQLLEDVASDRRTAAFIRAALAQLTGMDGRLDEARALLAVSVQQLRELGSTVLASSSSIDSAQIELLAGDLPAAERLLRADHDALTALGERYLLASVDGKLARALYTLDAFDEARSLAEGVRAMAMDDDLDAQAMWRSVLAMLLARAGQTEEAIALSHEAVQLRRQSDAIVLLADALDDFGEVLRFSGRDDESRAVRNEALRLYEQKGDVVSAGRVRTLLI